MNQNTIEYKGEFVYNWFSNFEKVPITIDDETYPSIENYYQSQKTLSLPKREKFKHCSPSEARKMGRKLRLENGWEKIKFDIMKNALNIKFTKDTEAGKKLMQTKGDIVEWNNWGDRFWGKTLDGIGENHLGKMLTEIRDRLVSKELIYNYQDKIDNYSWNNKIPIDDILEVLIFNYKPNMNWEYYLNKLDEKTNMR